MRAPSPWLHRIRGQHRDNSRAFRLSTKIRTKLLTMTKQNTESLTSILRKSGETVGMSEKVLDYDFNTIYMFDIIMGDNPACKEGCPIATGTKLLSKDLVLVNVYEQLRGERRHGKELYLSVPDRATMLLSRGYSMNDIVNTVLEVETIKQSRRANMKKGNWEKLNSAMDSAGRTLRNIVVGGRSNDVKPNTMQARTA